MKQLELFILFLIVSVIYGKMDARVRRFDLNENFAKYITNYGPVADIEYEISAGLLKELDYKFWLQLNIDSENSAKSLLTIVRLDNLEENINEKIDFSRFKGKKIDDTLWRKYRGWPKPLKVHIKGFSKAITIPANQHFDSLQMEIFNEKFPLFIASNTNLSSIPKIIHQVGSDVKGEPAMKVVEKAMLLTKLKNPSYEHHLISIDEMPEYIESLEGERVRKAFDVMVPMAYKADLFRYVALYHYGGIYMDSKLVPRTIFDKIIDESGHRSFITRDSPLPHGNNHDDLQIAFMGMHPRDPLMRMAIDQIVENVENNFYGSSALHITGPKMLGTLFKELYPLEAEQYWIEPDFNDDIFIYTGKRKDIIYHNGEYRRMQLFSEVPHYGSLWDDFQIYNIQIPRNDYDNLNTEMNLVNKADALVVVEVEIVTFE